MSVDYENTPLKDENGEIIRYHDGKPILYKHFLNDLPDEEHERVVAANFVTATIDLFLRYGTPIPESMKITEKQIDDRKAERKRLRLKLDSQY